MKRPPHASIRVSLDMGMIAFFILAALSLLVVYLADPAIYAQLLSLTSSPADRYPVPVTLFLVGVLMLITLLIPSVVRHVPFNVPHILARLVGTVVDIVSGLLRLADVH